MEIDYEGVERGSFDAFVQIVAMLRGEDGCPWDRAQTFESLKPCMVNEMTEALAGIDLCLASGDASNLCEELGDVLLQVVLLSQIAREEGLFSIEDVVRGISRKMLRRHPHVFGPGAEAAPGAKAAQEDGAASEVGAVPEAKAAQGAGAQCSGTERVRPAKQEVPGLWEAIKREEKKGKTPDQERREKEALAEAARRIVGQLVTFFPENQGKP